MYDSSIPCAAPESPRRPALEDVPRGVFSSNPFDFMQFRTLLRNGALATPLESIASALFSMQRRVGVSNRLSSRVPYTLPSSVYPKSFICHSYEKCRGVPSFFPSWFGVVHHRAQLATFLRQ